MIGDTIQVVATVIMVFIAAIGWLRNRSKDDRTAGEETGKLKTEVSLLRDEVKDGFYKLDKRMDKLNIRVNKYETDSDARFIRAETRIDNLTNGRPHRDKIKA